MVKRRRWKSKLQVRGVIMKKVVKFGGSSLANAEQFQKVGDIIRSDESRRYVVPSAPGKRFDEDIKVTDMIQKSLQHQYVTQSMLQTVHWQEQILQQYLTR